MGRTMFKTSQLIVQEALRRGFEYQITWPELENIIREIAGSNKQTMKAYRKELQILGYLKSLNNFTFEICPKALDLKG